MAVIRRVKDKIKKIIRKESKAGKPKAAVQKTRPLARRKTARIMAQTQPTPVRKDTLGVNEVAIEKTKFSHPQVRRMQRALPHDLPGGYGKDRMILQVRDPWWLHAYWEVTLATWESLKQRFKDIFFGAKKTLRVYDVSHIVFNGNNAHRYFDIELGHDANNWYIDAGGPGRSWCVDYGLKLPNGEFVTILRSNTVQTPLDGPSWETDEEWMVPDEMFGRLYGMGFGMGHTSVGKAWQERMKKALFSGILASPGITSAASPVKKPLGKERKFWLVVDCELIVYGATEPDAAVTVQGKPIRLRPDGTFTLRYSLPDGKQVIPVQAVSSDQIETRTITPTVSRQTQSSVVVKEEPKVSASV
ncbi:MAG: DUF4912 domain-containing protein [Candidatus Omnitrophica bacterium]|jgi:hypothetical protein|nr:DUF4912 domain-containing protein [Candidatus Omnitrophota bacterium]